MTEPRTAAGRALMEAVTVDPKSAQFGIAISLYSIVRHATPLIEAEARAAALDAPEVVALTDAARRIRDDHRAGYEPSIGAMGQLFRALAAIDELRRTPVETQ